MATHWGSTTISNRAITWELVNKMITSSIYVYLHCNQKKISQILFRKNSRNSSVPHPAGYFQGSGWGGRCNCSYNHQDYLIDEQWQVDFYSTHFTLQITDFKMAPKEDNSRHWALQALDQPLNALEEMPASSSFRATWLKILVAAEELCLGASSETKALLGLPRPL